MDTKAMLRMGLALMLVAGGVSFGSVSLSHAQLAAPDAKSEGKNDKKDIKQGDKALEPGEIKERGFKKGQKPTETMGTMGKQKDKGETKP